MRAWTGSIGMACGLLGVGLAVAAGGCASSRAAGGGGPAVAARAEEPPPRAASILHIVLVRLQDPLDIAEMVHDSLDMAGEIPSVTTSFVGLHLETGRATVVRDYDVCLTVGFDDEAGYAEYLSHPAHLRLLEKWGPRIEWLRIHDAQDIRP